MKLNIYGNMPVTLSRDPVNSMEAATKNYVDYHNGLHAGNSSLHLTPAQDTFLDALTVTSTEVNSLSGITSNIQAQFGTKLSLAGGLMTGFLTLNADPINALEAATKSYVDTRDALKVSKSGDTMTGALVLHADPAVALGAATKQYVDSNLLAHTSNVELHMTSEQNTFLDAVNATSTEVNYLVGVSSAIQTQINSKVAKSGDTMTGALVLNADPVVALGAATKQFVESSVTAANSASTTGLALKVDKAGDTMTGALVLNADPVVALGAATKQFVESSVTAANTASTTGLALKVNKAGDTMTGALVLNADPVAALGAATKQFVEAQDAFKVAKAGDTMTGALVLNADPVATLGAATKGYVDTNLLAHTSDEALHLTAGQNTFLDAVTVTSAEVNRLAGVTSSVQTQIDTKFDKVGGTITGDVSLSAGKTIFVDKVPASSTEVVNKAYVDSIANGLDWKDPVTDVNLVDDSLSTPPASPVNYDVYIVGAAPTGAWAGKAGYATFFDGTSWVFLQSRAVAAGDRFGVGIYTDTVVGATLTAHNDKIVTIVSATPGAITYTNSVLTPGSTTLVFDQDSHNFGISFTYTDELVWVPTNTSVNLVPGSGVSLDGSILSAKLGKGLEIDGSSANAPIAVNLNSAAGLFFTLDGVTANTTDAAELSVQLKDATLVKEASGIAVAPTVIADIADRVSKTIDSTVSASVTFAASAKLKVTDTPVVGTDVANKSYVDAADVVLQGQVTTLQNTVSVLNADPATKTYIDAQDALKVAKAGDTMTGALVLNADPVVALGAATKQFVDTSISTLATTVSAQDALKVAKAGDTMTGALILNADPTVALGAATKQFVESSVTAANSASTTGLALKVDKAGDTMTGFLTLSADPTSIMHAVTKQYSDTNLSTHAADASLHVTPAQNTFLDGITISSIEANYLAGTTAAVQTQLNSKVALAGGTMTGTLVLSGDPVANLDAATKYYVDSNDAAKVAKTGDTMTGALILNADPTALLGAVTKQYSDTNLFNHVSDAAVHMTVAQNTFLDAVTVTSTEVNQLAGVTSEVQVQLDSKLNLSGGTLTGVVTLSADPIAAMQPATKQFTEAQDALKVSKAGDTMTGALILNADPVVALGAATKQFVESSVTAANSASTTGLALKVDKAGDIMTGFLTLNAAPTATLHAATKGYVDDGIVSLTTYLDGKDTVLQGQITTLQGTVGILNTDPTTKNYVDVQDSLKVSKAGDTMTGYLVLHADPLQAMHPTTKQYVDAVAQGLVTKPQVRLASTVNYTGTYFNGVSGVNSTLTGTNNGSLSVDGMLANVGDRVLLKDQTNKAENGDYVVQQVGNAGTPFILKRVSTIDESSEVPGSYFYVYDGSTLKGTGWVMGVDVPMTFAIGTDPIYINQFSGQGNIIAGDGMTLTGNTLAVTTVSSTRIVVNSDAIDLATTGVVAGTYTKLAVDSYGRATAGSNPTTLAGYGIADGQLLNANLTSLSGVSTFGIVVRDNANNMSTKEIVTSGVGITVANGNGAATGNITVTSNATSANTASAIVARDTSGNFSANVITAALAGNADTATTLATGRNFSVSGDMTAPAVNFNGGAGVDLVATLNDTGVVAGAYTRVTVDPKGRVTLGTNPNTVADMGLIDAATITFVNEQIDALRKEVADLYLYVMSRI